MEKQRWEESEKRREEERRSEKRKSQKKEDSGARKGRKVAMHCVFQWFVAPEGRKVGSLKRRCGAIWPDERWTIARRCGTKHISKSKCTKHLGFGALLEVEMSKKCTPLWREAHFDVKSVKNWRGRLRCRKSARRCGAKHISMSKVLKTDGVGWDVEKVHAVVARSTFRCQKC